jgi:hypothetical protein
MKLKRLFTSFMLLVAVLVFNACSDSDAVKDAFIVVDRATGTIFEVNPSTGALTEVLDVTFDGGALGDIRGAVYNKSDKKLYVTSTDDGLGKLFSVNTETGLATLLNGNTNNHWYGLPDIILKDGKLICTAWHKSAGPAGSGAGLLIFNLNGTISETIVFETEDPNGVDMCCGFGLTTGSSSNELLIASSENGLEIVSSDMDGMATFGNYLTPEGFALGSDEYDFTIKNMVRSSGKIYALVYGWNEGDGNTYLAKVDVANSKLIFIAKLTTEDDVDNDVQYHGLAVVPGNLF